MFPKTRYICTTLKLYRFNSLVEVVEHVTALTSENALEVISHYDIIVDASDNVATR